MFLPSQPNRPSYTWLRTHPSDCVVVMVQSLPETPCFLRHREKKECPSGKDNAMTEVRQHWEQELKINTIIKFNRHRCTTPHRTSKAPHTLPWINFTCKEKQNPPWTTDILIHGNSHGIFNSLPDLFSSEIQSLLVFTLNYSSTRWSIFTLVNSFLRLPIMLFD